MKANTCEITAAIVDFFLLLKKHPDQPSNVTIFTNFFRNFLRIRSTDKILPTMELTTLLKHEKPIIFSTMRKHSENLMYILSHMEMDIEEARERISRFIEGEK